MCLTERYNILVREVIDEKEKRQGFVYDEYGSLRVRFVFDVGCDNLISITLEVTQNQLNSIKPCANI